MTLRAFLYFSFCLSQWKLFGSALTQSCHVCLHFRMTQKWEINRLLRHFRRLQLPNSNICEVFQITCNYINYVTFISQLGYYWMLITGFETIFYRLPILDHGLHEAIVKNEHRRIWWYSGMSLTFPFMNDVEFNHSIIRGVVFVFISIFF